jgi:hypothetical protein
VGVGQTSETLCRVRCIPGVMLLLAGCKYPLSGASMCNCVLIQATLLLLHPLAPNHLLLNPSSSTPPPPPLAPFPQAS